MINKKLSEIQLEIYQQPEVIFQVLNRLKPVVNDLLDNLVKRNVNQILIVGSGDSWFLGKLVRLAFEQFAAIQIEAIQAFEYAVYGKPNLDERSVIIVISSSGRPSTTVDALERALLSPAYVVGVSDRKFLGNPFIEKADFSLVPEASKSGAPTQSTMVTFAVLLMLAIELGKTLNQIDAQKVNALSNELMEIPNQMKDVLVENKTAIHWLSQALAGNRLFFIVGGGPSFGVAQIGSGMLFAIPKLIGLPIMVEEFHHAWRPEALKKNDPVILIAPSGLLSHRNFETAQVAKENGANLIVIVDKEDVRIGPLSSHSIVLPTVSEVLSPFLTLLPLQQLSISLATENII
jgi:glutamine---fructose-6-phosphate transaminase (isomerizing)